MNFVSSIENICYSKKSLLYVNDDSLESFPGFNEGEKKKLTALGIEKVDLMGHSREGDKTLASNISVEDLKTRKVNQIATRGTTSGTSFILILLLVVVILGIVFWPKIKEMMNKK